ncbi:MAG: glucosaminidase domain-containing protein, partial [Solibacillus sp.]
DIGITAIMGSREVSILSLVELFNSKAQYPGKDLASGGAADINQFCSIVVDEAKAEGVRADVVFAQAMLETGWLKFGGDVKVAQFNFAGLGATGGGSGGASFLNVSQGIRAQVQHLKAYASKDPLRGDCVDPRFYLVKRGCAPYVEWLGQKENPEGLGWATGKGYGGKILGIMNQLR